MMNIAWCCLEEVPYWFSRSSVKCEGHRAIKIIEFDPDWAIPECNSSLNSPMATKWCTKLEVAWKRYPIVFEGQTSNLKVTRLKKNHQIWPRLDVLGCLNSLMDLKWYKAWYRRCIEDVPYYFWGHPLNFKVTLAKNRRFESNLSKITRPVTAIKSLRFASFKVPCKISRSHRTKNCRFWPKFGVSGL